MEAGLRGPREKKRIFFWRREKKAGTGLDFSPKKKPVPSRSPAGAAWSDFFSRLGRAGTGLVFLFRGPGRDWIFFRGTAGLGTRLDFFSETGLDFSLLEQSAEPRSKDSQRKSRPTGKPSSNEKSSPVSEACRGGLVGFFFRGPAGPGRDWFFYFADAKNPDPDFSRGAKNPVPSPLYFAAKKKSSPVEPKNPVPSGALGTNHLYVL